ncbi:MAG TPA: DUF4387 domain-containing protein [Massilibacterium sp.]|nr:DUF4387 domain-containing protein [Massilibacterium sp.]
MKKQKLTQLAKVIRSKNAGPFEITFDIMFDHVDNYERAKNSETMTKENLAKVLQIKEEEILHFVFFDQAMAIKLTTTRSSPSGSAGERDVYGAQAYPPLLQIEI